MHKIVRSVGGGLIQPHGAYINHVALLGPKGKPADQEFHHYLFQGGQIQYDLTEPMPYEAYRTLGDPHIDTRLMNLFGLKNIRQMHLAAAMKFVADNIARIAAEVGKQDVYVILGYAEICGRTRTLCLRVDRDGIAPLSVPFDHWGKLKPFVFTCGPAAEVHKVQIPQVPS